MSVEILLETLFKELFSQTLNSVEQSNTNPNQMKNQNEILRCYTQLGNFLSITFHTDLDKIEILGLFKALLNLAGLVIVNLFFTTEDLNEFI